MVFKFRIFKVVALAFLPLALSLLYTNCTFGGFGATSNSEISRATSATSTPGAWNVSNISFTATSNQTFDLSKTLPECIKNKGVFSVDKSGTPLQRGMTLSPSGIMSVGSAAASETTGVIFVCTEP